jgi:activating signal cointegrator complex subunit 1
MTFLTDLVHSAFKASAYIVETRPLLVCSVYFLGPVSRLIYSSYQLHCTILNTSYRKLHRQPFSYAAVLDSSAFAAISALPTPIASGTADNAVPVNMGAWAADEIQICVMGSHGVENEYISCGGISLCT